MSTKEFAVSETPIWDEMVKEHGDPLQSEDRYVPEPVPDPEPVTLADELFDAPPPPTKRTRIRSKRSR